MGALALGQMNAAPFLGLRHGQLQIQGCGHVSDRYVEGFLYEEGSFVLTFIELAMVRFFRT